MDPMDKNNNSETPKQELIRLSKELRDGIQEKRSKEELEKIRQRISMINFTLSYDSRKIHDIH
jgi:hypothetical protein